MITGTESLYLTDTMLTFNAGPVKLRMQGSNSPSHIEQSVFEFCFVTWYCFIKRLQQHAGMLIYS